MSKFAQKIAAASLLLGLMACQARGSLVISTSAQTNGNIGSFGTFASGSTPTYGETFVDPAGNPVLQSVTFFVNNSGGSLQPLPFQAEVFAYNTTTNLIVGSALYTSTPQSILATATGSYAPISITGIDTTLTPGNSYIVLFTTIGQPGNVGGARFLTSPDTSYANGTFAYSNEQSAQGLATNPFTAGVFGDLAFDLTFTAGPNDGVVATPEPATLALGAMGALAGFAALRRRKTA